MNTVLHRSVCSLVVIVCLTFGFLALPSVSQAATVNYGSSYGANDSVTGNSGITNTGFPPDDAGGASGNIVNVTGGTVNSIIAGGRHGATTGSATASGNQVNIATFAGSSGTSVDGGFAQAQAAGNTATANGNTVDIAGGTFSLIRGGSASSDDGPAFASGNTVRVTGVTAGVVYGGQGHVNTLSSTETNTANNNQVFITDSTVLWDIYGGNAGSAASSTQAFVHNNNSVTLIGATTVSGNVYGGASSDLGSPAPAYNNGSGNTLNIKSTASGGISVTGDVQYFQNYNFYIPAAMTAGEIMLSVGGTAYIDNTTVNVGIEGGSSPLAIGDSVVLIDAGTLDGTPANTTANGQGMQGVTLRYVFDLSLLHDQLLATVASVGANPQLKSLSEGRAAGHAFVNQGSDLILGSGLNAMLTATQGTTQSPGQSGFVPFFTGSGGWSRYDTGSHVDVSGFSMMTGLAWRQPVNEGKNGSVLAGAFFEAGWGNYDSHNSFSNAASVKGDGDLSYYGGGVLGRYDFAPATIVGGPGNLYLDASFRAGQTKTDFNSSDLRDGSGRKADYDSSAAYYGMHAGIGYLWNVTDKASLDLSTRYIWTHQDSDTVNVLGDPVKFKASDSHRWRTGARFAYAVNEYIAPYAGAYYDHEFDGKARASTNGYGIDAPDLAGGTGIGELGLTLKPSQTLPLSFDLGVQGYVGIREGVTGSLQVKFEF